MWDHARKGHKASQDRPLHTELYDVVITGRLHTDTTCHCSEYYSRLYCICISYPNKHREGIVKMSWKRKMILLCRIVITKETVGPEKVALGESLNN